MFKGKFDTLQQSYEYNLTSKSRIENEKILVDICSVYKGIEYYRVFIECLPPGTVPDIPFMSTLLDLVRLWLLTYPSII